MDSRVLAAGMIVAWLLAEALGQHRDQQQRAEHLAPPAAEHRVPEPREYVVGVGRIGQPDAGRPDAGEGHRGEGDQQVVADQQHGGQHRGVAGAVARVGGLLVHRHRALPQPQ
jgi:hypothetical protein